MTHKIISTGPYPGHSGACMAHFNHKSYKHNPSPHPFQPTPINQPVQNIMNYNSLHGGPSWNLPSTTFPTYY